MNAPALLWKPYFEGAYFISFLQAFSLSHGVLAFNDDLDLQLTRIYDSVDFLAVKTFRGQAQGVAVALESIFKKRITGTIAGDNMVLVIVPTNEKHSICNEIFELANVDVESTTNSLDDSNDI